MANLSASSIAGLRIRQARQRHGWTAAELAARCAKAGAPQLSPTVITNIETRRRESREVSVDELLILAHVLGVPPVQLMIPLDAGEELEIVPGVTMGPLEAAGWAGGSGIESRIRMIRSQGPEETAKLVRATGADGPLLLIRQIAYAGLQIALMDEMAASDDEGKRNAGERYVSLIADRLMHLAARMQALGYDPPGLEPVREILKRHGLPSTLEEWRQQAESADLEYRDEEEPGAED